MANWNFSAYKQAKAPVNSDLRDSTIIKLHSKNVTKRERRITFSKSFGEVFDMVGVQHGLNHFTQLYKITFYLTNTLSIIIYYCTLYIYIYNNLAK